jgi:hypothetical protein
VLHTKALYNLLRFNLDEDPSIPHEPWAVENLRTLPIEELFFRLAEKGISLDRERFLHFGENCDTPEELTDLLLTDASDSALHDPVYLLVFELWRRLLPQKPSLSIFCDELDHLIELYDRAELESDEPLQDALANLQEIFDENADSGAPPREVFSSIEEYCAHDIEDFLYDFIADLFECGNTLYASELIEGFSPYVPEPLWFEILNARLLAISDIAAANRLVAQLLKKELDLPVLLEVLRFLATAGDRGLFVAAAKKAISRLETEEEFRELLTIVSDFYRLLDLDELEQAVQKFMKQRKSPSEALDPADPDLRAFAQMIH